MSKIRDKIIVGTTTIVPDRKMDWKNSHDVKILIRARGIQPINDELLTKNAMVIEHVIIIIFLSNYGLSLLK